MDIHSIAQVEEKITALVAEKGLLDGIASYLAGVSSYEEVDLMPNGDTAYEAAEKIVKTAGAYVSARDARLSVEDLQDRIAENCADMTAEQVLRYLAAIHVCCDPGDGDTPEERARQVTQQFERLMARGSQVSLQEHIDTLLEGITPDRLPSVMAFVQEMNAEELIPEAQLNQHLNRMADARNHAIRGAALYAQAVQGALEGIAPETDAGLLTARAAAVTDSTEAAMDTEAPEQQLHWIENAFISAVALSDVVLCLSVTAFGSLVVAAILAKVGLHRKAAQAAGIFCFLWVTESPVSRYRNTKAQVRSTYQNLRKQVSEVKQSRTGICPQARA